MMKLSKLLKSENNFTLKKTLIRGVFFLYNISVSSSTSLNLTCKISHQINISTSNTSICCCSIRGNSMEPFSSTSCSLWWYQWCSDNSINSCITWISKSFCRKYRIIKMKYNSTRCFSSLMHCIILKAPMSIIYRDLIAVSSHDTNSSSRRWVTEHNRITWMEYFIISQFTCKYCKSISPSSWHIAIHKLCVFLLHCIRFWSISYIRSTYNSIRLCLYFWVSCIEIQS